MPKIPLEKGYSQMDWLRLTQRDPNLNGLDGKPLRQDISMAELRKHKSPDDAWMVLNDLVFNIGPYLRFHPGGSDILLKSAGRDATSLFMKYHPWVNVGALMSKCLVGRLAEPSCAPSAAASQDSEPQAIAALGPSKSATATPNTAKPEAAVLPGASKKAAAAASDDAVPQATRPMGSSKNAATATGDVKSQATVLPGAPKKAAAASDEATPRAAGLLGSSKNTAVVSDDADADAEPQATESLESSKGAAAASDNEELQATARLG
uniref:Cytochrome b5 heme-binding domain-containing protein n=1 Tax=Chlamydomonas euryale TaxID=1486919 RepID=A0A7R9VBQ8_9CHLO|mmetsp:Transcript_30522/g.90507  ORF Transcript_30522/g.90507 Transcript_30522/m.90507 type:complete len:265 (+) Transcript_30522:258-1052(+)